MTERPVREHVDEPRTFSNQTPAPIVRGDPVEYYRRSKYPNSTVTLFHGVNVLNSMQGQCRKATDVSP